MSESNSNLIRCQNHHLFSRRRHGTKCPYCGLETVTYEMEDIKKRTDESGSIHPLSADEKVCAWLVCTEGIRAGKSYEIRNGSNSIGRGYDMDIQILGDKEIEVNYHAIIVYDKKTKQSKLFPGTGKGLVYYKGDTVYSSINLTAYDEIEIGNSKFLFIPFTGKKFNWEETE